MFEEFMSSDGDAMMAVVDQYCESNPLDTVLKGVMHLIKELKERAPR